MKYIADDLVRVKLNRGDEVVLGWGDPVEVDETRDGVTRVRVQDADGTWMPGQVKGKLAVQNMGVLKFTLVDVQQGDGMVLETPSGKVMIIDGGDNQLFARYLAARFRRPSETDPLPVEAPRGETNSTGYARRSPRGSIFGRGFDSRRLQFSHPSVGDGFDSRRVHHRKELCRIILRRPISSGCVP